MHPLRFPFLQLVRNTYKNLLCVQCTCCTIKHGHLVQPLRKQILTERVDRCSQVDVALLQCKKFLLEYYYYRRKKKENRNRDIL
jgi:hypothetical protein